MPGLSWKGLWDASINMPCLSIADKETMGQQYLVSEDGCQSINGYPQLFSRGDEVISNGMMWEVLPRQPTDNTTTTEVEVITPKITRRLLTKTRPIVVYTLEKSRILVWERMGIDSGTYHIYVYRNGDSVDDYIMHKTQLTTFVDIDIMNENEYYVFDENNDPITPLTGVFDGIPLSSTKHGRLSEDSMNIINAPGSNGVFLIDASKKKTGPFHVDHRGIVSLQGRILGDDDRLVLM